jgi:RNA polymerase sigma factor (sigma-70 family)
MEKYSLQETVTLFNSGDADAFRRICDTCQDALLNFIQRYFSSRQEAEDITSETLLKLWKHRGEFCDIGHIRLFVFKVAKHASYDRLRHTKVYKNVEQVFFDDALFEEAVINEPDWVRSSLADKVNREIQKLPERCREVICLAYFDRLTNPEIAAMLGIREKTVRNLKSRGMNRLRLSMRKRAK